MNMVPVSARQRAWRSAHPAGRRERSKSHLLAQRREAYIADPGNLTKLLHGAESAALLPEVENLLRRGRPDTAEHAELLERGGIEVDRVLGHRGRGRSAGCRCGGPGSVRGALGNTHLLPILELGGEIEPAGVHAPRRAARAFDGVVD